MSWDPDRLAREAVLLSMGAAMILAVVCLMSRCSEAQEWTLKPQRDCTDRVLYVVDRSGSISGAQATEAIAYVHKHNTCLWTAANTRP